jgi:uncharacterized protein YydD (DUF2326 family)
MKLSSIYSNKPDVFPPIRFGPGFNVVFARVKDFAAHHRDSHNLGKSLLVLLIDFCLLAGTEKDHALKTHADRFGDFVFYLELLTNAGRYVTVRRAVSGRSSVSLHVGDGPAELTSLPDPEWSLPRASVTKGKEALNELLALDIPGGFGYRKGLRYCLRRQSDYDDVFRIGGFRQGSDAYWKPYVAAILGFDPTCLDRKYKADKQAEELEALYRSMERQAGARAEEYDALRGRIQIREDEVARLRAQVDSFRFGEFEARISEDLVGDVEVRIAELNEARYTVDYELSQIDEALASGFAFDIDQVRRLFDDAGVCFPGQLARDYDQLLNFSRRLSSARAARLKELRARLGAQRQEFERELTELDGKRSQALAVLRERESLAKFKALQTQLSRDQEKLLGLRERLASLDVATETQTQIDRYRQESAEAARLIREQIQSENPTYALVRKTFANYVREVLHVPALLSTSLNKQGNLDFSATILDREVPNSVTSEAQGTSYRKLLCACFDLAALSVHSSSSFYRFVYHDGVFEGLDNRRKVSLLTLVRRVCAQQGLQYILTVIDSDLPRNEDDSKLLFEPSEVVRELHDEGDDGRLFKMPRF